jgi:hypothetical protein
MMGAATATASLCPTLPVSQRKATKPKSEQRVSTCIEMRQTENMMDAVAFAKLIGLPLVAHLTIHWAYADIGEVPVGREMRHQRQADRFCE